MSEVRRETSTTVMVPLAANLAVGLLAAILAAAAAPAQTVRDSAGVRIVHNTEAVWSDGDAWRLSTEPELHIGVMDGDPNYQFFRPDMAHRLNDGTIVLANRGSLEVRGYGPDGRHRFTTGGEGGGPGEFRDMHFFGVTRGDSLIVHDRNLNRISILSPEGEFMRSFRFEATIGDHMHPWVRGVFRSGDLLASIGRGYGVGDMPDGLNMWHSMFATFTRDGERRAVLGRFPYAPRFVVNQPSRSSYLSIPYAPFQRVAVGPERVVIGYSDAYRIDAFTPDGEHLLSIRRDHEREPVTDADVARRFEASYGDADPNRRRRMRRAWDRMPMPETKPAFADLVVDRNGYLWVDDGTRDGLDTWTVFRDDGVMLGDVAMPARLSPSEIGDDYALGFWRDEFGVRYVRMYRLVKPPT